MLVEQQFQREYAYAQHGNYLRHQVVWSQPVMDKLARFPTNCQNDKSISSYTACRGQSELQEGLNTHVTSVSSKLIGNINPRSASWSCINPRLVSGGSCSTADDNPKLRQEVSAFGPKHAERARRFYQETLRSQRVVLVPPCRPTYDFNHRTSYNNSATGQVSVNVASYPRETVLKVTVISPRLKVKRQDEPTPERASGEKIHRKRSDNKSIKKSVDFEGTKNLLTELSKAPLFQILCEISNTK